MGQGFIWGTDEDESVLYVDVQLLLCLSVASSAISLGNEFVGCMSLCFLYIYYYYSL